MLLELRVENLLLIESAELRLAPGLNVLTGETGAGKTILAQSLDLLLGGRARSGIVRPGAGEAYVEGVLELPDTLDDEVRERLPSGAEELVLARRVGVDGRTRAYVNGRAATVGELRDLASGLITFYGQHEHRRLTLAAAALDILDGFCGSEQLDQRRACAAAHERVRELQSALEELRAAAGSRERELDLIEFELEEIESAAPDEQEYQALRAERQRLRHVESLRSAAGAAAGAVISGGALSEGLDQEGPGATGLLAHGLTALDAVGEVDPELDSLAERCRALMLELEDAGRELTRYAEALDCDPGRLEAAEERLNALERLMRKHGGSIAAVIARAEECRARREDLTASEVRLAQAERERDEARTAQRSVTLALRERRARIAPQLADEVRRRMAALAMDGARFEVELGEREAGPAGADSVEFLLAANAGVPPGPVRDIASGGELSRVMLALMGASEDRPERGSGAGATLVFDEVDAGIGGHAARAVGEQLRALAGRRQLLCITHLPQIASLAERHFCITREPGSDPARASVRQLAEGDVVSEIVRMLGSDTDDVAARRHAKRLRQAA